MGVITPNCLQFLTPQQDVNIYILNTVNCNLPCTSDISSLGHWVVICVEGRHDEMGDFYKWHKIEIFDCLGDYIYNTNIETFIKKFPVVVRQNVNICMTFCSYYCLVYAFYRARNYPHLHCIYLLTKLSNIKHSCKRLYSLPVYCSTGKND